MIAIVLFLICMLRKTRKNLHMLQLNSYRNSRYLHWLKQSHGRMSLEEYLIWVPVILALFDFYISLSVLAGFLLYLSLTAGYEVKKPLVMTKRAKRLFLVSWIFIAIDTAIAVICFVFGVFTPIPVILLIIGVQFSEYFILLANTVLRPIEKKINRGYYEDAQRMIQSMPELNIVAITGSYGKTSCKMILGAILSEEYMTLTTPQSYNTPMGITRVIREMLRPTHQMLVLEMGAKQKGDIEELCKLAAPKVGILTSIGEQHLETFGSLENIIATKFELIMALPSDGIAVLNMDDENIAANLDKSPCRVVTYGFNPGWDYYADHISYSVKGLAFTLHAPEGESIEFASMLLGRHNVSNILAAVAAAHSLGVPLLTAVRAVKTLPPVEHRLQILPNPAYTIIDDAFNSNPQGSQMALEVLQSFTSGKKIMITPGMVELGAREYELNKQFGKSCAQVCDFIILVGKKQTQPLQDGLKEAVYPVEKMYVAADLNDARTKLAEIVSAGDVVLFENDLPDTYNES